LKAQNYILESNIQSDPTSCVLKLICCQNVESVRHIQESFGNKSRLACFHSNILQDMGITLPGGFNSQ